MDRYGFPVGNVFQSTHPVRGATWRDWWNVTVPSRFQSTHPVRGATTALNSAKQAIAISIHAPREGCDLRFYIGVPLDCVISIHAPREGCDLARLVERHRT